MMRSKRFASGDPTTSNVTKDQPERPLGSPSRFSRDKDKTPDQPVVIQWKTKDFVGSESDYARVSQQVVDVGMGKLGDFGIGEVGVEVDSISGVKAEVKYMGTFRKQDPNTISGFIIDYHTARGYSKRVALYLGSEVVKGRYSTNPAWGKGSLPDANFALKTAKNYDLDLKRGLPRIGMGAFGSRSSCRIPGGIRH